MNKNNYSKETEQLAKEIQEEFFRYTKELREKDPIIDYDSIKDIYLFLKIAELQQEIKKLKQFKKEYGFI